MLHLTNHSPLKSKICLEIGSGWVLTSALILYLLGAKRVIATDISNIAHAGFLDCAVKTCIPQVVRDLLSPFGERADIQRRINKLMTINHFTFNVLRSLGIEYIAPLDLSQRPLEFSVDFVCSFSVLEHVPIDNISQLLHNTSRSLNRGGSMIHCIHLEDHQDIFNQPFSFLSIPGQNYDMSQQGQRGNRIRKSQWLKLFNSVAAVENRIIYSWYRTDRSLPDTIDTSVIHEDERDLICSHLGIYSIK